MSSRHEVDLDLLADYIGGALDGTPQQAAVERLIADDPAWARAYAETSAAMDAVRADLNALGADRDRMPADVVDRLAAALTPVPHDEGARVVPLAARRQRWVRRLAPVAVAASLLISVGVGAAVLRPDGTREDAGNAGFTSGSGEVVENRAPAMGAPGAADAEGGKPGTRSGAGSPGAFSERDAAAAPPIIATGTDYTRGTLSQLTSAVTNARAKAAAPPGASGASTKVPQQLHRLTDPAALSACLAAITGTRATRAGSVQLVDLARFEGSPAVVVLLDDAVWVSGPACGLPGPDTRFSTQGG